MGEYREGESILCEYAEYSVCCKETDTRQKPADFLYLNFGESDKLKYILSDAFANNTCRFQSTPKTAQQLVGEGQLERLKHD